MTKTQKWSFVLGFLLLILIAIRITLPYVMKAYINHQLAYHPEYTGEVRDVSLQILQGGVSVSGIRYPYRFEK